MIEKESLGEKQNFTISELISYLPILSLLAISYGVINQTIYYLPFHINILQYTDLNELLLASLYHLVIIVIPLTLVILSILYLIYLKINNNKLKRKIDKVNFKRNFNLEKLFYGMIFFTFVLNQTTVWSEFILIDKFDSVNFFEALIGLFFAIIFLFYATRFKKVYRGIFNHEIDKKLYGLIYTIIFILWFSICGSLEAVWQVQNKPPLGTYLIIDKDTIKSTKKFYYIGRTKNNVFFYNADTKNTFVYDNKNIKLLSIH